MKFKNIQFPFFSLLKVPDTVNYSLLDISVIIDNNKYLLDTKRVQGTTYIERLVHIRSTFSNYLEFEYTSSNLVQLIRSKSKWGIDNKGKIFDLSKKEIFPFKCAKVDKTKNDLVWVKGISYPFEFKYGVAEEIDKFLFAYLAKINDTWYIIDFSYKYSNMLTIRL